jgi:hypothetical protein
MMVLVSGIDPQFTDIISPFISIKESGYMISVISLINTETMNYLSAELRGINTSGFKSLYSEAKLRGIRPAGIKNT